jgi:hypothetical protein
MVYISSRQMECMFPVIIQKLNRANFRMNMRLIHRVKSSTSIPITSKHGGLHDTTDEQTACSIRLQVPSLRATMIGGGLFGLLERPVRCVAGLVERACGALIDARRWCWPVSLQGKLELTWELAMMAARARMHLIEGDFRWQLRCHVAPACMAPRASPGAWRNVATRHEGGCHRVAIKARCCRHWRSTAVASALGSIPWLSWQKRESTARVGGDSCKTSTRRELRTGEHRWPWWGATLAAIWVGTISCGCTVMMRI